MICDKCNNVNDNIVKCIAITETHHSNLCRYCFLEDAKWVNFEITPHAIQNVYVFPPQAKRLECQNI